LNNYIKPEIYRKILILYCEQNQKFFDEFRINLTIYDTLIIKKNIIKSIIKKRIIAFAKKIL
ncbi:hypothetical protein, partial [Sulfurovum riftiae]|uniref:hypothetical protein n=1 Tax=Sulfurovum riftiae TaxID=1630136 RepID=UPI000AF7EA0B